MDDPANTGAPLHDTSMTIDDSVQTITAHNQHQYQQPPQQQQQPPSQSSSYQQAPHDLPHHTHQQQHYQHQQSQQQQQLLLPDHSQSNAGTSPFDSGPRPQTSYSDTGFQHSGGRYSDHAMQNAGGDTSDNSPRFGGNSSGAYGGRHSGGNTSGQHGSRPGSSMSYTHGGGQDRASPYLQQGGYGEQGGHGGQQGYGNGTGSGRESRQGQEAGGAAKNPAVVIKVGMVGDAQIGKTSLMVKYVEGSWDEDYIQTLGVNFMEKTISIRNTEITFSIWDLGGQREFVNMLPLVCNDAVAILFMFDLTRKSTLNSIKEWYRQGRGFNKTAIPFLVGTKYDHFVNFPREEQEEISNQARRFAKAMKAPLIFSSTSHSINVQKIFKIVLAKAFDLRCTIPEIENIGEPLLLYQAVG